MRGPAAQFFLAVPSPAQGDAAGQLSKAKIFPSAQATRAAPGKPMQYERSGGATSAEA